MPGVAVHFTEAQRPEAAAHVRLESFDGPLALLLALIEQRELDILTVRLGDLTGAYLEALAALPGERLPHVSAFVAVAAQLILITSRARLPPPPEPAARPGEEGPDPEVELRERLLLYRVFRDAGLRLSLRLQEPSPLFHREAATAAAAGLAGARPSDAPPLDPRVLAEALERALALVPPPAPPPELLARVITLAERAEVIRAALRSAPAVVLQELLAGTRDRVVIAVTFLALLELVKRREVVAEQAEPWGPIYCRRTTAEERAAGGFPIEPAVPLDEALEGYA
ncbi:MAG: segregation and condensation protein A [Candidatus Limnocylindrales bacterium]